MRSFAFGILAVIFMLAGTIKARADDSSELAKKLANPVADLVSVPMQSNWDFGIGPNDSTRYLLNVQPVIPFSIGEEWNLITRTIVPFIDLEAPVDGAQDETGLGDILQSFFFSPKNPIGGWIVGFGPALYYPTASEDILGSKKWGAGPTGLLLQQDSGWTYGALANQIWSYAGEDDREDLNSTFVQPFLSYTTKTATTIGLNTESTYDWKNTQWTVPMNLFVAQMLNPWNQPIQLTLGGRSYVDRPDGGPDWGLRFVFTLLFPK